jgi:hypothetical protein
VAWFQAYLHDRHALLADISARNEGHAPKCVDWDLKATRKIEGWARGQWVTGDPRLRMKAGFARDGTAWPTTSLAPIRPTRCTCDSRKEPTCIKRMGGFRIQFCWAEIQELDVSKVVWTGDGAFSPPSTQGLNGYTVLQPYEPQLNGSNIRRSSALERFYPAAFVLNNNEISATHWNPPPPPPPELMEDDAILPLVNWL